MKKQRFILILAGIIGASFWANSQENTPALAPAPISNLPTYLSLMPNLNDFDRFANGGPDANWYVGFNNAWIVQLPPAPAENFVKTYIGAKIGRAKTFSDPDKPWQKKKITGEIYMAISQTPAFSSDQSFFLVDLLDIPTETDPQNYVENLGAAQWFWAEVPVSQVNSSGPNYLIVWSPTDYLLDSSSSPILAGASVPGAASGSTPLAWNNHSIGGVPPRNAETALETPLNNLYPALALKLIPANTYRVTAGNWDMTQQATGALIRFSVSGEDVLGAWIEISPDQIHWQRKGPEKRRAPFQFFIPLQEEVKGFYVRGAAEDEWGNQGNTAAHSLTP